MQKQRKKTQKERKKKRKRRRRRRDGDQRRRCSSEKKKRKKKPETPRPGRARRPGSRCDLDLRVRPVSPAWIWRGLGWLKLISISSSSSSLSFFFSFFLRFLPLLHFGLHFGSLIFYFWVRNRDLETRFPCRRHLEKVPRKRGTTHENRALKTRFRSPKSSL